MAVTKEDLLNLKIDFQKEISSAKQDANGISEKHRNQAIGVLSFFLLLLTILGYFGGKQIAIQELNKRINDGILGEAQTATNDIKNLLTTAQKDSTDIKGLLTEFQDGIIVPKGTIVAWSPPTESIGEGGTYNGSIPKGWALCDGNNGTPDLRDKFIMGTSIEGGIGTGGGARSHSHPANFTGSRFEATNQRKDGTGATRHDDNSIVITEVENLPPFVKLVYIMKL